MVCGLGNFAAPRSIEATLAECWSLVTNLLATVPATAGASASLRHRPEHAGRNDNASAVAVLLELARRLRQARLKTPVLFAAFTREEPPAYFSRSLLLSVEG